MIPPLRYPGGVPRLINLLSDACLLVGFELKRKQIDQFLVEHHGNITLLAGWCSNNDPSGVNQIGQDFESLSHCNIVRPLSLMLDCDRTCGLKQGDTRHAAWFKRCCSRVTPKIDGALLAKTFRDSTVTLV